QKAGKTEENGQRGDSGEKTGFELQKRKENQIFSQKSSIISTTLLSALQSLSKILGDENEANLEMVDVKFGRLPPTKLEQLAPSLLLSASSSSTGKMRKLKKIEKKIFKKKLFLIQIFLKIKFSKNF
uniref:Uncharacterized protein n=1 Tax=Romanomermis culicivorax TaxID=13658 RepID=A0A915HWY1_ROMCU